MSSQRSRRTLEARSKEELAEAILDHPFWYHRIDLGGGFYSPGYVDAHKYLELDLPEDLSGKSVLDIGSYNGLLAFEAERRGADPVLATDLWEVDSREAAPEQDHRYSGFELAHAYLDSDIDARSIDLFDVSPERLGRTFDIVLCAGVIYRLEHPTVGIENLVSVADERIVLTSMYPRSRFSVPAMEFYPAAERMNDPTIWWMPNEACLEGLLTSSGCSRVDTTPLRDRVTDDSTPPYSKAVVKRQPMDLYRDHGLTHRTDRRAIRDTGRTPPRAAADGPAEVPVLYETDGAARVMYTDETDGGWVERKQAWVDADALDPRERTPETPVGAAIRTLRSDGLGPLIRRSIRYARGQNRPREYLVHAFVD